MKTITTALFICLIIWTSQCAGQYQLRNPVNSKNGNSLELRAYIVPICGSNEDLNLLLGYDFPNGFPKKNNKWLNWKQDFEDCNGNIFVQEFYAPLCAVFAEADKYFYNAYTGDEFAAFDYESEGVYPNKVKKFKKFVGNPYDVIELTKYDNYLPSKIDPKTKCENPVFTSNVSNINSISINWTHNTSWVKSAIRYRESNSVNWSEVSISSPKIGQNNYTINNLKLDTSYEIQFGATCNSSSSLFYANSQFTRTQKSQCPIPDQIRIGNAFADSLTITWLDNKSVKFIVEYREKNKTTWLSKTVYTNKALLSDLKFDTNYEVKVAGFDTFGQGPFSSIYNIMSATNPAPSIYSLRSQFNNPSEIFVQWETSLPNSSTAYKNDITYECTLSEVGNSKNTVIKNTTFKKIIFSNLKFDTEYKIEIQATLLGKWKGDKSKPLEIQTDKITKTLIITPNSIYCDSLLVELIEKQKDGTLKTVNQYRFYNQEPITTSIEFGKNSSQYPYSVCVSYNSIPYPSNSVSIASGVEDTILVTINMPLELLTIFEKSKREIIENSNPTAAFLLTFGLKYSNNHDKNNSILQPETTASFQLNKFSLDGSSLFNQNNTKSTTDLQFFSKLKSISIGYNLISRKIKPVLSSDRRFGILSLFTYNSKKTISPIYDMTGKLSLGLLNTQSNYIFNLYNISNYTRNSICSNQTINSVDFGFTANFSSNYVLTYLQKGIGKKLINPDQGKLTKRVSQFQVGLNYYKPLNGTMEVTDVNDNSNSLNKIERKAITDGFKFNIQHTYNIRNSHLTITKGISFYKSNHYYNELADTQSSDSPVIVAFLRFGLTNLR
jgi:hypothetical protein